MTGGRVRGKETEESRDDTQVQAGRGAPLNWQNRIHGMSLTFATECSPVFLIFL